MTWHQGTRPAEESSGSVLVEDLQKSKRKEDDNATKIVDYVHCPFAEEMKERQGDTVFYRRSHLYAILSLF